MGYLIRHKITVGNVSINGYNSVSINSDIENFTQTANIFIPFQNFSITPNELLVKNDKGDDISIKVGDEVRIKFFLWDYFEKRELLSEDVPVQELFIGYVSAFDGNSELVNINCEDSMWLLKQKRISYSYPANVFSTKALTALLNEFFDKETVDEQLNSTASNGKSYITDIDVGKLRTGGEITGVEVLKIIKQKTKFYSRFINVDDNTRQQLYFGLKYQLGIKSDPIPFAYPRRNDSYTIIKHDLKYNNFDKINDLVVNGVSTNGKDKSKNINIATINGTDIISNENKSKLEFKTANKRKFKVEVKIPDLSLKAISALVLDGWNNHPDTSFEGSFTTFGGVQPLIQIGSIIRLNINDNYNGRIVADYFVNGVTTKVTLREGLIQTIKIGSKIKDIK